MNEGDFKEMFKKCIRENAEVCLRERSGNYGEKWVEITLEFDGETISTAYLDLPGE